MIAIEFDRAKMRHYLLRFLAVYLTAIGLAAVFGGLFLPHTAKTGWLRWFVMAVVGLVAGQGIEFFEYALHLWRSLKRKTPAFIVNYTGITDNASRFALGRLAWDQVEKIYPTR